MADESYFDYAKTASDIGLHDTQKQKLKFDMVKDFADDTEGADVMANLAQSWNAPGQQRGARGALRSLFMGMASGMKGAAKKDKRERLEKLLIGAEGWEDVNNSMKQMLESKKQEALLNEKLQPAMDDLTIGSASGEDANSLLSRANDWIKPLEASGAIPTGSQVVGVLPNQYRLIYKTPDGQEKTLNYLQKSSKGAQDKIKLILEQKGMDARTMSAEASKLRAEDEHSMVDTIREHKQAYIDKSAFDANPVERGRRAGLEERAKKNATYIHDREQDLFNGDEALQSMKEIRNVIDNSTKVGSTPSAAMKRWYAQKTGDTADMDTIGLNSLAYLKNLKQIFGNVVSDSDLRYAEKTWPTMDKNPQALLNSVDKTITAVENKVNLYRKQKQLYDADPTANLFSSTANITKKGAIPHQDGTTPAEQGADGKGGGILMFDPNTGKQEPIPEAQVKRAEELGLKRVMQ